MAKKKEFGGEPSEWVRNFANNFDGDEEQWMYYRDLAKQLNTTYRGIRSFCTEREMHNKSGYKLVGRKALIHVKSLRSEAKTFVDGWVPWWTKQKASGQKVIKKSYKKRQNTNDNRLVTAVTVASKCPNTQNCQ